MKLSRNSSELADNRESGAPHSLSKELSVYRPAAAMLTKINENKRKYFQIMNAHLAAQKLQANNSLFALLE